MKCHQDGCDADATLCYRWPGQDLAGICEPHSHTAQRLAGAMGMTLDFRPVEELVQKQLDASARSGMATALRGAADMLERGEEYENVMQAVISILEALEAVDTIWERRATV